MLHASAKFRKALLWLLLPASERLRLVDSPHASGRSTVRPARIERRRRRALWLASVGIDNGPRVIHGVKVGAAR